MIFNSNLFPGGWCSSYSLKCCITCKKYLSWNRRLFFPPTSFQLPWSLGSPLCKVWQLLLKIVALQMVHFGKCSASYGMRCFWFGNWPFMLMIVINLINLKLITGFFYENKDNLLLIVRVSSDVNSRLILSCKRLV